MTDRRVKLKKEVSIASGLLNDVNRRKLLRLCDAIDHLEGIEKEKTYYENSIKKRINDIEDIKQEITITQRKIGIYISKIDKQRKEVIEILNNMRFPTIVHKKGVKTKITSNRFVLPDELESRQVV